MLPVVAIVGRPNVGKSTLFNVLTRTRDAIVAATPGVTRDRQFGIGHLGDRRFVLIDTGGLSSMGDEFGGQVSGQTQRAVDDADVVLFVVDARDGLTADDYVIARQLRQTGKPLILTVNKTEHRDANLATLEFHELGLGEPQAISAAHRHGIAALLEAAAIHFPDDEFLEAPDNDVRVAIVGRPNVGKSTLVNQLLGEQRVVASETPGTTRDSILVPFRRAGRHYTLIDTAGIRRKSKVEESVERLSVIKALQAIAAANVVILMLDARDGVTDQDASLLGHVIDAGRALTIAVNKWDAVDAGERKRIRDALERKFRFMNYARIHYISALEGTGLNAVFRSVVAAWKAAFLNLPTPELSRLLAGAVAQNPPPMVRGRRIKLRYAHQGGSNPPIVVIHGNQTDALPDTYKRYLAGCFRAGLQLEGTPLRIELRTGKNPYQGRRNVATPRQIRKRKRLLRHVKR